LGNEIISGEIDREISGIQNTFKFYQIKKEILWNIYIPKQFQTWTLIQGGGGGGGDY
jgi:hypothetical protein